MVMGFYSQLFLHSLQSDIPITFLCLIIGVGSISRVCVGSTSEKE